MTRLAIKGWCPGALKPMMSGDGLVVRVRPYGGRLDAMQAAELADLAERYGNGLIDATSRANLQIRGVTHQAHPALLEGLSQLKLIDRDPEAESRRNVLVTPFWGVADDTSSLAAELEQALAGNAIDLPTKFGFAVDDGEVRVLAGASADIRIERDRAGGLIVRADGIEFGHSTTRGDAVNAAIALAEWFVRSGGVSGRRGRMATHVRPNTAGCAARRRRTGTSDGYPPSRSLSSGRDGRRCARAVGPCGSSTSCCQHASVADDAVADDPG